MTRARILITVPVDVSSIVARPVVVDFAVLFAFPLAACLPRTDLVGVRVLMDHLVSRLLSPPRASSLRLVDACQRAITSNTVPAAAVFLSAAPTWPRAPSCRAGPNCMADGTLDYYRWRVLDSLRPLTYALLAVRTSRAAFPRTCLRRQPASAGRWVRTRITQLLSARA